MEPRRKISEFQQINPYNPYDDGEVACVWELMRRNSNFREFEKTILSVDSLDGSFESSLQGIVPPMRGMLFAYANFILKHRCGALSEFSWRALPVKAVKEKGWTLESLAGEPESQVVAYDDLRAVLRQAAEDNSFHRLEPVCIAENLYRMDPDQQRNFLSQMEFHGFIPVFLLERPYSRKDFNLQMEKVRAALSHRVHMDRRKRRDQFGTREQWDKFLVFEAIKCRTGYSRGRTLELTIERIKGTYDDRAYHRDFEHAIDFIEGLIESALSASPLPVRPENRKRSRKEGT